MHWLPEALHRLGREKGPGAEETKTGRRQAWASWGRRVLNGIV